MSDQKKKYHCDHGKRKQYCKDCGGSALCKHGKRKSRCKECGGSALCKHGKEKDDCKDCGGSAFCVHGKRKRYCKDCGGSAFCVHGKDKSRCKDCGGSQICVHGKVKSRCRECGGSAFCVHGKDKSRCKECGGSAFCVHGKDKSYCKDCGGSAFCVHEKRKERCKECGGSELCKSSWCETIGSKKYKGYCRFCCIHLFPDIVVSKNYKTKENEVVSRIKEEFPNLSWVCDKKVSDGCSKRRPDMLLDMGSHIIIIEVDENKHVGYECSCDNKRLMEISQDLGHRPIIFIRFNPDGYVDQEGKKIKSCWKLTKQGIMTISKKKEWEIRITSLKQQIRYWMDNSPTKTIETVEMFY